MKKAMFTLLTAFAAVVWVSAGTTSPTSPLVIKHASGAINIDGVGDDAAWGNINAVDVAIQKTLKDPNFGGNFKLTYDQTNIYVLVTVNDATPNQDGASTWQSDCVELFFAMDTNTHSKYQSGDWQIRKIASKSQADGGVDGSDNVGKVLLEDPNFKVEQVDGATGYVQEWQLPINTLKQDAAFDGQNIRFDIQLADNDGTGNNRTDQRFWNDGADDQWNQTTHMGYVKFEWALNVKPVAKASSIRIKANSIEFAKSVKEVNVYSITGQLMLKAQNVNAISTSALKSGVYFVVADGEKAKFVIK
ncbi:MAG: T9SS type A sorting domain-containing protein [Bacteroidales bacterium]|nr:T9SS type A sorting domain-containing protein [Bacteroidales bacterium]